MLKSLCLSVVTFFSLILLAPIVLAQASSGQVRQPSAVFESDEPEAGPRSDFLVPTLSFFLPGLGQYGAGQNTYGMMYSGTAILGYAYMLGVMDANHLDTSGQSTRKDASDDHNTGIDAKDVNTRKIALGAQVAQAAGGMSSYHAFRTAVRSRQKVGKYQFLTYDETPAELLTAPFHFEYLARSTTLIPLAVGAGLAAWLMSAPPDDYVRSSFTSTDGAFAGAFSYNAGTHEEAVFRGWLMPLMYESWGSPFWSNAGQAVLFGVAHLNTVSFPVAQLLLGYHLGNVTQKRGWLIGESVFIHAWWDVLAFVSVYNYREKLPDEKKNLVPSPVLWLPPLAYQF